MLGIVACELWVKSFRVGKLSSSVEASANPEPLVMVL
jgi:hypothetical protein